MSRSPARPLHPQPFVAAAAVLAVMGLLLVEYLVAPDRRLEDPVSGLQQLDLLYLDEPAPRYDQLHAVPGRPLVLVVCQGCRPPPLDAPVTVTDDPQLAAAYGLLTADGRVGPGYALIDAGGRVRYRTFDPNLSTNSAEIAVLVASL